MIDLTRRSLRLCSSNAGSAYRTVNTRPSSEFRAIPVASHPSVSAVMKPLSFEHTGRYYRQPIEFGPCPTLIQDNRDGSEWTTWDDAEAHSSGIVFNVGREELQALLPEGYIIDPNVQPTVLHEILNLRNLPWLAGRGYNIWGVYANDVICQRVSPPVKATYLLILFESLCDPINVGREDIGYSKLWAEMPDEVINEEGTLIHTASWLGFEFMRMEIPKVIEKKPSEAASLHKREWTMPFVEGIVHHRYIPAIGQPGKADASYATFLPGGGDYKPPILRYRTTEAPLNESKVTVTEGTFEQLPTLWNVAKGLASLKLGEVREVAITVTKGVNNIQGNHRIEW